MLSKHITRRIEIGHEDQSLHGRELMNFYSVFGLSRIRKEIVRKQLGDIRWVSGLEHSVYCLPFESQRLTEHVPTRDILRRFCHYTSLLVLRIPYHTLTELSLDWDVTPFVQRAHSNADNRRAR